MSADKEIAVATKATGIETYEEAGSPGQVSPEHGPPGVLDFGAEPTQNTKKTWRDRVAYLLTKDFWFILVLGQILAICITGTNTLTTLLVIEGTSIPAFQTLFNYVLLNAMYTGYTFYRYGFKKWAKIIWKDGWKCWFSHREWYWNTANGLADIILSFCDVEGNYFTVLAYRYTTILSAQLISFWAIVIVVTISFLFLKVRYHWAQVGGILVCVGGTGLLIASDHITGANGGDVTSGNQLKGDLFALAGATFYGFSNVAEEFLVSERPLYEVVGQLGFWGTIIK
jgi:solute carrier family 35 protein F1/2